MQVDITERYKLAVSQYNHVADLRVKTHSGSRFDIRRFGGGICMDAERATITQLDSDDGWHPCHRTDVGS